MHSTHKASKMHTKGLLLRTLDVSETFQRKLWGKYCISHMVFDCLRGRFMCTYLPIHMLAWQESVEGSWADGPSVAPSADRTSAAWLVTSWYSWMNWYRFMMRDASTIPFSLLICEEAKAITWIIQHTGIVYCMYVHACSHNPTLSWNILV